MIDFSVHMPAVGPTAYDYPQKMQDLLTDLQILGDKFDGSGNYSGGSVAATTLSASGLVKIGGSARTDRFAVLQTTDNEWTGSFFTSGRGAGLSFGLLISAGTNSTDTAIQVSNQAGSLLFRVAGDGAIITSEAISAANGIYVDGGFGAQIKASTNGHNADMTFYTESGGTEKMRLTNGGLLLIGTSSGANHTISSTAAAGSGIFLMQSTSTGHNSLYAMAVDNDSYNNTNTAIYLGKNATSGRSINAAGTINASGADVAENKTKRCDCGVIAKGQIVGLDADGKITDQWALSVNFRLKSGARGVEPAIVMGDTWGTSEAACVADHLPIGARPLEPAKAELQYDGPADPGVQPAAPTEPALILPTQPTQQQGETDVVFSVRTAMWQQACSEAQTAYDVAHASYMEEIAAHSAALTEWQSANDAYTTAYAAAVAANDAAHALALTQYEADLVTFNARLEANRQTIDRLCYCGTAWCELTWKVGAASPQTGDYIVAVQNGSGIGWSPVAPDEIALAQLHNALGRIERLAEDGTPLVAR